MPTGEVRDDIAGCGAAHARVLEVLDGLAPGAAGRPSRLPGWTVGHVLTHLARNADSHVRMLVAGARGEVADQYEGGWPARVAAIEEGAGRPESELVADVAAAAHRLEETWAATPDDVWARGRGRTVRGELPLAELPFRRWREVEVHGADLGLGFGWPDWSPGYVAREMACMVGLLPGRVPSGRSVRLVATDTGATWTVPEEGAGPVEVAGPVRLLLAWLLGREEGPGFPPLGGWEG